MKKFLILAAIALLLSACDNKKSTPTKPPQPSNTQDNPLLNMQQESVGKVQNAIEQANQEQAKQLEAIEK